MTRVGLANANAAGWRRALFSRYVWQPETSNIFLEMTWW